MLITGPTIGSHSWQADTASSNKTLHWTALVDQRWVTPLLANSFNLYGDLLKENPKITCHAASRVWLSPRSLLSNPDFTTNTFFSIRAFIQIFSSFFWQSYEITLNTSNPDLPLCFQHTALSWPAPVVLFCSLPLYLYFVGRKPTVHWCRYISKLNSIKTVSNVKYSVWFV